MRKWLLQPVKAWLLKLQENIMSAILDASNKLSADIDAKVAADAAEAQAAAAKIADLESQLAAANAALATAQANEADVVAALAVLQAADAKLTTAQPA